MSDVTKKPVHPVLTAQTPLEASQGRFEEQQYARLAPQRQPLPEAPKAPQRPKIERPAFQGPGAMLKQESIKRRLRIYYDNLPDKMYPEEKTPPCNSCKTAVCCSSFVVPLQKEEYESGLYDPYAVKLTYEAARQLSTFRAWKWSPSYEGEVSYAIEGIPGEPCPFLGKDRRCTIYDWRPLTCREYTCVGDERITQEMRDGVE